MITIYETNDYNVIHHELNDQKFIKERTIGLEEAFAFTTQVDDDLKVAVEIYCKNGMNELVITLLTHNGVKKHERIVLFLDGEEYDQVTNELGEVIIVVPRQLSEVKAKIPSNNKNLLFLINRVVLVPDNLVEVFARKIDGRYEIIIDEFQDRIAFDGTESGFINAFENLPSRPVEIERGRVIKYKELFRQLKKHGCVIVRSNKHPIIRTPEGRTIAVPFHNGDIKKGTLNSILRKVGMSFEELISL